MRGSLTPTLLMCGFVGVVVVLVLVLVLVVVWCGGVVWCGVGVVWCVLGIPVFVTSVDEDSIADVGGLRLVRS